MKVNDWGVDTDAIKEGDKVWVMFCDGAKSMSVSHVARGKVFLTCCYFRNRPYGVGDVMRHMPRKSGCGGLATVAGLILIVVATTVVTRVWMDSDLVRRVQSAVELIVAPNGR